MKTTITPPREAEEVDLKRGINWYKDATDILNKLSSRIRGVLSADPEDPDTNEFIIWQSDGTGSGNDGDLMIKITDSNDNTKTGTVVSYSGL